MIIEILKSTGDHRDDDCGLLCGLGALLRDAVGEDVGLGYRFGCLNDRQRRVPLIKYP